MKGWGWGLIASILNNTMKLVAHWVNVDELQSYLDKFQDKIKFVNYYPRSSPDKFCLIIDES